MSAEVIAFPRPPRSNAFRGDPLRFGRAQQSLFTGMNLHVGASTVVHAVSWVDWINDLTLPAPHCRQAFGGHGFHGELRPTRWPVTCRRCRRLRGEDVPPDNEPDQLDLFAGQPLS